MRFPGLASAFGHFSIRRRLQLGPLFMVLSLAAVVVALEVTQGVQVETRNRAKAAEMRVLAIEAIDHAVASSNAQLEVAIGLLARGHTDDAIDAKVANALIEVNRCLARVRRDLPEAIELRRMLAAYGRLALQAIEASRGRTVGAPAAVKALSMAHRNLSTKAHSMEEAAFAYANQAHDEAVRASRRGALTIEIVVAMALTTMLLNAYWTYRSIVSPICRMQRRMMTLAEGDLDTPIPEQQRHDEIGSMAATLDHFRHTAQTLHRFAYFDPLTGLANRAQCQDRIRRAVAEGERSGRPFALMLLDLDHFKEVNDTLGHDAGDMLLQEVSTRLQSVVRPTDMVARLGGDEFAIVQEGMTGTAHSEALADRVLEAIAAPFQVAGQVVHVGVSVGIASCPRDGTDATDLMKHADLALYEAKHLSRHTFRLFEQRMSDALVDRRSLENKLRRALDDGDIGFVYQPKRRLCDGAIIGVETLARWTLADGGRISPAAFVPVAEQTGLVAELGAQALENACREIAGWRRALDPSLTVAVNLSVAQFKHANLPLQVESALARHGLEPGALILELTESVFIDQEAGTLLALAELGEMGVRIALDDFGTGYASLGYLRRLPFSELKIDQSFVRDVDSHADALSITRAIISLGHALDMQVTAEGVESEAQLRQLRLEGCDVGQGYLFGRPEEATAIGHLLAGARRPATNGSTKRIANDDAVLLSAWRDRL